MKRVLKRLSVLGVFALALTLVGGAGLAKAGFVPVYLGSSVNGSQINYNYTLNFSTNGTSTETLKDGDFVTLYDIGPATVVAPGLTTSQSLLGVTPSGGFVTPTDNASLLNLTFTYHGADVTTNQTFAGIVITSPYNTVTGIYTSTDSISTGKNNQIGNVVIPSPLNPTPEPASIALMGLGGLGLAAYARRRNRNRA